MSVIQQFEIVEANIISLASQYDLNLQLVATLSNCSAAICDKIKQSSEGAIQAVIEFVTKRGNDLNQSDVSRSFLFINEKYQFYIPVYVFFNTYIWPYVNRTTQSLLSATVHVTEKYLRQEILGAVSFLTKTSQLDFKLS